jgi:GxxExxY protein
VQILPPPHNDAQTRAIIGAAMNVHRILGPGFLEVVYQEALALEFGELRVPYQREADFSILYRGCLLRSHFRVDFLCFGEILVELKALPKLSSGEESQILNYLKASGRSRALLLNFGARSLGFKRFLGARH